MPARRPAVPSPPDVVVDARVIAHPDLATIDGLARLALAARRAGAGFRIRGASPELRALIAFAGLSAVLACEPGSVRVAERQPEQREQAGGVEEERQPRDAPP